MQVYYLGKLEPKVVHKKPEGDSPLCVCWFTVILCEIKLYSASNLLGGPISYSQDKAKACVPS